MSIPSIEDQMKHELRELSDKSRNVQNANDTERALCGQLMLIATVFLTITAVSVTGKESLLPLKNCGRTLLFVGFLTILASIFAGIKYYLEIIPFYEKWGESHSNRANYLTDNIPFKTEKEWDKACRVLNSHVEGLEANSNDKWLKIQIKLLSVGGLSIALLTLILLFNGGQK